MKVLYDHQAFSMQRYGGVSKCFCEIIKQLNKSIDCKISVKYSNNYHLYESKLCDGLEPAYDYFSFLPGKHFKGKKRLFMLLEEMNFIKSIERRNLRESLQCLEQSDFDVFHPTYFDPYFLKKIGKKPFVLTIHDMMPELFPEYYRQDDNQIVWKKELVKKARHIIAVSENTKKDIVRILKINPDKISVIYHGGPEINQTNYESPCNSPYFLFVGMRNGYKNFFYALSAFKQYIQTHKGVKLICIGMPFEKNELDYIDHLGIQDDVIQTKANDTELSAYYSNALAFIYPSLYEGFGMPILEAYSCGCPIILNNKSCFPEIAGDAAVYFDSSSKDLSLLDTMNYITDINQKDRNSLVKKGFERLQNFSWRKSADELLQVYNSLI